jgi:hypothetical protein
MGRSAFDGTQRLPLQSFPADIPELSGLARATGKFALFAPIRQKTLQTLTDFVGLLRRPSAKALSGLHAKLALRNLVAQERMRSCGSIEVLDQHVVDVQSQVKADQIGLLQRSQDRQTCAKAALYDLVDSLCVTDAVGDQRDRLAF